MPNHKEKKARNKFYRYDDEGNVTGLNEFAIGGGGKKGGGRLPTTGSLELARRNEGYMFEKREDGSDRFSDFRGKIIVGGNGKVYGYKMDDGTVIKADGTRTLKELERNYKRGGSKDYDRAYRKYITTRDARNRKAKNDREYFQALRDYKGPTATGAEEVKYEDTEYIKSGRRDQYKRDQAEKAKAPVRKVSTPIRKTKTPKINMFNMKPKDQALGKFSYAAIQAKKAGKKFFEYAGKTFPVQKGTYGNTNKALYKAKMPAMYKLVVKAHNKLDK